MVKQYTVQPYILSQILIVFMCHGYRTQFIYIFASGFAPSVITLVYSIVQALLIHTRKTAVPIGINKMYNYSSVESIRIRPGGLKKTTSMHILLSTH